MPRIIDRIPIAVSFPRPNSALSRCVASWRSAASSFCRPLSSRAWTSSRARNAISSSTIGRRSGLLRTASRSSSQSVSTSASELSLPMIALLMI
ncbi:MAG TPA: hypothetical protein VGM86_11210 [Thermoanaerobaculia bacterium]